MDDASKLLMLPPLNYFRECASCFCQFMQQLKTFDDKKELINVLTIKNPCEKPDFPEEVDRESICVGKSLNKKRVTEINGRLVVGVLFESKICSPKDIEKINREVITTPFSYVATTSSLVWEGLKPIYVDIKQNDFNINENLIESAITEKTTAILATHVFGVPNNTKVIKKIAEKYNLKVIYDAAHCFGAKNSDGSVFDLGDISITSFHATKLFHTVEGGALFTQQKDIAKRIRLMRNFGHDGPTNFSGIGINGKMSEIHAAMGIVNLRYINSIITSRKSAYNLYKTLLDEQKFNFQEIPDNIAYNYPYFPLLFEDEVKAISAQKELFNKEGIQTRRYFHPILSELDYVEANSSLNIARDISSRILCLPLYADIDSRYVELICNYLNSNF